MLPVSRQQQQSATQRPTNNKRKKKKGNNTKKFNNNNNSQRPNWRKQKLITQSNWSPTPSDDSDQEVCLFQMAGRCDKADCPFSHDVKIPKLLAVCKHYVANSCSNIELCRYLHQEFPCKFFFSSGQCHYGSDCKFSHERNELTTFLLEKYYEDEATRMGNVQQKVPVIEMPKYNSPPPPQSSHNIETKVVDTPEYVSQLDIDPSQIAVQNQMEIEEEEEQQHHPVQLPVFSHFYQDTTEEPQKDDNNDTPMPLEITSILSTMEDEPPPSSPPPINENQIQTETESFLFSKQLKFDDSQTGLLQGNPMYPAKVITITLPSINEHSDKTNDIPSNEESSMIKSKSLNSSTRNIINWRVCKVRSTKRIDYHHIKECSSTRDILMDPRLNKHRT